jgi:hypothetical protein
MTVYKRLLTVALFAFTVIGCAKPEAVPTATALPTQAITLSSSTPTVPSPHDGANRCT